MSSVPLYGMARFAGGRKKHFSRQFGLLGSIDSRISRFQEDRFCRRPGTTSGLGRQTADRGGRLGRVATGGQSGDEVPEARGRYDLLSREVGRLCDSSEETRRLREARHPPDRVPN